MRNFVEAWNESNLSTNEARRFGTRMHGPASEEITKSTAPIYEVHCEGKVNVKASRRLGSGARHLWYSPAT